MKCYFTFDMIHAILSCKELNIKYSVHKKIQCTASNIMLYVPVLIIHTGIDHTPAHEAISS